MAELGGRRRRRPAGPAALAGALALGLGLGSSVAAAAEPTEAAPGQREGPRVLPRDSPLYGPPYRYGLAVEVAVGVAACQPGVVFRGVCAAHGGSPALPGVGLRLGAGWRFNPRWLLTAAWVRQGHRPGGSFVGGQADGGVVAARVILPLPTRTGADSHVDLGFELGLGGSLRTLIRDEAPNQLRSYGGLVRPAVILEGWVLADLAIGIELASQLNLHWQHCADSTCAPAPGAWIPGGLGERFVDGFTIAVRATGLVYPHL